MRAGPPDATDRLIALGFGRLAVELLAAKEYGRMCAILDGRFGSVPIDSPMQGERRVDVAKEYDARTYRPRFEGVKGMPLFDIGAVRAPSAA
jgi:6-phosphofructokinase 1